jgi:outer membrane protein OmpA-like peptidoglycan-associated protein
MRKTLLLGTIMTLVAAPPLLQAQDLDPETRQQYETRGVLGGLAAGAAAGGPPGAIVGAIAGGWISEQVLTHKQNRLLKTHLEQTRAELLALQERNTTLQQQLSAARQAADNNLRQVASTSLYPAGLSSSFSASAGGMAFTGSELVLHFRSGSVQIENHYRQFLQDFVKAAALVPDAIVDIQGHADRRGDSSSNLMLSQQRVKAVETELKALGLKNVAWNITANGEQAPITSEDNFEANFFDRRVVLRVHARDTELLSTNTP